MPVDERFFDKYEYSTSTTTYNRGMLGDATKEMGPFQTMKYLAQSQNIGSWYSDDAWFVFSGAPWIFRGGGYSYGTGAGVFHFFYAYGDSGNHRSFRIVLAI